MQLPKESPAGKQGQLVERDKDTRTLPRLQRKVIEMLRDGGRYSAADISAQLHLSDPRGHISKLRRKGFTVLDEWVKSEYGTRYKVYFVGKRGGI